MNIDSLVRTALERIRSTWGLPESGFIAGGSIANIVWELVSGKKAVVNDIDVFIFNGIISEVDFSDKKSLFKYQEKETKFWEDYSGMRYSSFNKDFYTIEGSEHNDMFNRVKYKSNKIDTDIILRSFDINATKVGYSIDEDKCYWTPEFQEFLNTGELKVCNVMTPAHTAVRIVKKQKELDCKLDHFEIDLLKHVIENRFSDVIRYKFKSRYFDIYNEHIDIIGKDFLIKRDNSVEDYIRINFNEETCIYYLEPVINSTTIDDDISYFFNREVFNDKNLKRIHNTQEFLFYMRNIYGKDNLPNLWSKLYFFFNDKSYVDCQPTEEELELVARLGKYAPNSIENLRGKKLSEQISLVKWILEKYEEDPIVAISILEKHKISQKELDEQDLFLLELSVRKQIVNDTKGKVNKVLNIKENFNPMTDPDDWL
jgi:hypothetical protein